MSRTVRVNATMDDALLARIDAYAERHYEDRSTALRQLADFALRELALRESLDAYRDGRVTLREMAKALGVDTWTAHDLLRANGVAVAQGEVAETASDVEGILHHLGGHHDDQGR